MTNPGENIEKDLFRSKKSIWKTRFKILLILFILTEIALRIFGFRAGTLIDDFKFEDHPVYQKRFFSDAFGINRLIYNKENFIPGVVINRQGFRGSFDYTKQSVDSIRKHTRKKIVMMIGDSFTEGCCPDHFSKSFPDLLHANPNYCVLNFGVSCTDPVQYNIIVEQYVKKLKPDMVVIAVYCGNDLPDYRRPLSPGTPIAFPFKNNRWLFSVVDNTLSMKVNYVLKTDTEAYAFFVDHYTLKGTNRNIFEKMLSYSVCFSKVYLGIQYKIRESRWKKIYASIPHKKESAEEIANTLLKEIKVKCETSQIPVHFFAIPSPVDIRTEKDLKAKYQPFFKDLDWHIPDNIATTDYDGPTTGNHFNNSGHQKYYFFMRGIIEAKKQIIK